jgi:hypothetical protein
VVRVALTQDIFDFREEMNKKGWTFRRFLHELSSKQQTEAEIRDELDYRLDDYSKSMERFKIERAISFWETYIIPTVEALERIKPSAFLKGLVSIRKRKLALMEAEMKAPGRECAYVFEAQKRFGSK